MHYFPLYLVTLAKMGKTKSTKVGWRDGSVVKSTDCSSKGPEFNSQQPHGGSQPPVMGSDALFWCLKTAIVYSYKLNKYIFEKHFVNNYFYF